MEMIRTIVILLVLLILNGVKQSTSVKVNIFNHKYGNFSHLLYYGKDNKYVIAATQNHILRFSSHDLVTPIEIRKTGPVNDSVLCTKPNECLMYVCNSEIRKEDKCSIKPTDVFVKSWTTSDSQLIVCYNVYQGYCETLDLYHLQSEVQGKGYSIVTFDLNSHSSLLYFDNKLYFAIEINHALNYLSHEFYVLSIRTLPNFDIIKAEEVFKMFYGKLGKGKDIIFPLEFKGSFHIIDKRENMVASDYIFFLFNQPENKHQPKDGKFQVRLARICAKDENFLSYIDIGLNCGSPNYDKYYQIDSWHLANVGKNQSDWYRKNTRFKTISTEENANFDQILFINFKVIKITMNYLETLSRFVTCAYPIAEVMELLDVVKKKCQNGYGSVNIRPYNINSSDKPCFKEHYINPYKGYCDNKARNKHIIGDHYGDDSGIGHEIIIKDGLRAMSINVFSVNEKFTIALIGGSNGNFYKYELFENKYKELEVQNISSSEILDITTTEDKTIAFAISNSKIVVVNFTECDKASNCKSCLNVSPFCGWCISTGRCSRSDDCKVSFWMSYERDINSKRCPEITGLSSHNILDYKPGIFPEVKFQIVKIPDGILIRPRSLQCSYYSKEDTLISDVNAKNIKDFSVTCDSISYEDIPQIPFNYNFVTIKLKIFVDDSFLVESQFYIYDCSQSKTCSQCSENNFTCSWCILDNTCKASVSTKCLQSYLIQSKMSHQCPQIEFLSKTVAFPVGFPIDIDLKVKTFNISRDYQIEFHCIESCGNNTVKAFSTRDVLKCQFNDVKTPPNKATNCSVSVIWKIPNLVTGYLENVNTFSFQVYNCTSLTDYCDDCLFLPQIYNCGFCMRTKKCVIHSDCGYNNDKWISQSDKYCPSPIINEIFPGNSSLESGSIILVKGRNFDFHKKDIQASISFENNMQSVKCIFIDQQYISSRQFMCQIEKVAEKSTDPVIFDFVYRSLRSSHLTKKEFIFYTPKVTKIYPNYGPFMGGSMIKVTGESLNIGYKRFISLIHKNIKTECDIIKNLDTFILCRLKDFHNSRIFRQKRNSENDNSKAFVSLTVDLKVFDYNQVSYTFYPNPTNIKISRNRFLSKGGQYLQVTGVNIHIINNAYISFFCKEISSTLAKCDHKAKFLLCLTPIIDHLIKVTDCELRLSMEKTILLYKTTVNVYPMATFANISVKKNLPSVFWSFFKNIRKDETIVKFKFDVQDQIFVSAFEFNELNVSVGRLACHHIVVSIKSIECSLSSKDVDTYQNYPVMINIGKNFQISLGQIQFAKGDISLDTPTLFIIVLVIFVVFIIIISLSITTVKKMQKKNKRKNQNRDIFSEKTDREANEILKQGIAELNDVTIQHDVNRNCLPMYPYCVYILYNLFPNTHPRLFKENRIHSDSILNINNFHYDSSDPNSHPLIFNKPIQVIEHTVEYSRKLSKLFEDELFVLILFSFLDDDDKVVESKKSDIVSLLSLILMQDMTNYSQILKILIKDDYDKKKESGEEKSMFRQSDLLSKLLSNWFIILMYNHFQTNNPGGDLLTLYFLILNMINNGPVDFVTNQSQYALNEKSLLKGKVNSKKMKIKVVYPNYLKGIDDRLQSTVVIDILTCDTVTQVKLKILEEICKYIPYSKWYNVEEFTLVRENENEQDYEKEKLLKGKYLKEIDREGNCYKTMGDHNVQDGDVIVIYQTEESQSRSNSTKADHMFNIESKSNSIKTINSVNLNKMNVYIKHSQDIDMKPIRHILTDNISLSSKKSPVKCCKTKKTTSDNNSKEINPCCIIYTQVLKKKLEPSIKTLFDDILDQDLVPQCIKDLFSYFNTICKDEKALFSFKSNSLILRFWIHFITNVDFLFDVPLASNIPVMECLNCIGRILMDVCSESQNSDVWITQLFSDIIKEYSPKVVRYYDSIDLPEDDYNDFYGFITIDGINISLAIVILYHNYIKPIHDKFIEAIKSSNKPIDRQNKWITILKEVNNLYSPEVFFSNGNGDTATSAC